MVMPIGSVAPQKPCTRRLGSSCCASASPVERLEMFSERHLARSSAKGGERGRVQICAMAEGPSAQLSAQALDIARAAWAGRRSIPSFYPTFRRADEKALTRPARQHAEAGIGLQRLVAPARRCSWHTKAQRPKGTG